jgi:hypothetical protein
MYKATIVIPNINGKGWLKDSIESVYAQTEQNFQLIVVDNGSTGPQLLQPGQLHPDRKRHQHRLFPRGESGHRHGRERVCGAVQQRRLCGAPVAGRTHPHRRNRPQDLCGAEPDDPPL